MIALFPVAASSALPNRLPCVTRRLSAHPSNATWLLCAKAHDAQSLTPEKPLRLLDDAGASTPFETGARLGRLKPLPHAAAPFERAAQHVTAQEPGR
jgi:hypothetical protein